MDLERRHVYAGPNRFASRLDPSLDLNPPHRRLARVARAVLGPPAIYLAGAVLGRVGSFILIPIYTRTLSLAEYGDYAIAQTIVLGIQTVLAACFSTPISRFYFEGTDPEAGRAKAGAIARWYLVVTLAGGAALSTAALLAGHSGPGLLGRWELMCLVAGGVGSALGGVPYLVLRIARRPIAASIFNLALFLTTAVSGIVLVAYLGRGLRGAIEAIGISGLLTGTAAAIFVLRYFRTGTNRAALREALRFALPLVPDALVTYIRNVMDRWVLKLAGLDDDVGGYALAQQLMTPAAMVSNAWNDAEGARVGELYRRESVAGVARNTRAIAVGYLAASGLPALGILISTPLLEWVVGKDFAQALWLLPFVGLALVVESLYSPWLYVVYYANRTKHISMVTLVGGVVNVASNVALIPLVGLAGAVVSRIVTSAVRVLLIIWAARYFAALHAAPPQAAPDG